MAWQDDLTARRRRLGRARVVRRPAPRLAGDADTLHRRGAACPPDRLQWALILLTVGSPLVGLLLAPDTTWAILHPLFFVAFTLGAGLRLVAALTPRERIAPPPLPDTDLPRYTIIAPLYGEAEIAPGLIAALEALDYPRDRLQALVVLEADDAATLAALDALDLPPFIEVTIAPPGHPRTKPRACNVALELATGELLTIYDAEDRPDPGQLREAAARFAAGSSRLACLQAPLRIDPDHRFIPAQFGLEYAVQFEVVLPFLVRIGLPFPLGGTSNHFRIEALKALGGWDAWNVTEDADMGFRLAAEGYDLGMLERPTLEAPPRDLHEWLPQRTRWVKGYMQTFGVQARNPPHWRTGAAASLVLTLGVAIAAALLHGPLVAWTLIGGLGRLAGEIDWVTPLDLWLFGFGWVAAGVAAMVGGRRAGRPVRMRNLLLAPFYWPLHSLAGAHAIHQLFAKPYYWDKTPHRADHGARTGQARA